MNYKKCRSTMTKMREKKNESMDQRNGIEKRMDWIYA